MDEMEFTEAESNMNDLVTSLGQKKIGLGLGQLIGGLESLQNNGQIDP